MADGETLEDAFYRLTAHGGDQPAGADSEAKDEEQRASGADAGRGGANRGRSFFR